MVIPQNGRERPDETGADRLSAEPTEPEGERHRAPHVCFELHGLERDLQAREPRCSIAPERQPRLVALDEDRFQSKPRSQRAQLGHQQ